MNKENVLAVADAIEGHTIPDLGFNMEFFTTSARDRYPDLSGHNCGTIACIAGVARALRTGTIEDGVGLEPDQEADWLGIDQRTANNLFYAYPDAPPISQITPAQAVKVLRHLAKTGKVDWSVA